MADEPPFDVRDIFDDARESDQRLAMDVIQYPAEKRDAVLQRMGILLTEIALEVGCPHEMASEFGAALEQTIRAYVAEIEPSGGGPRHSLARWFVADPEPASVPVLAS